MHGIIHAELKNYVTTKLGAESWNRLLAEPGIGPKLYLSNQPYPDEDIFALVTTASKITVAKGIARGLGRHYQEKIMISETECMHKGGGACRISVRKVS